MLSRQFLADAGGVTAGSGTVYKLARAEGT